MQKVGIFSGTFDPVHAGHIAFALEAARLAGLDKVYFLPEALPRRKAGVTHYAHRQAMLKLALRPYRKLQVLELPDKRFSVSRTLPRLKKLLPEAELHMLVGSDMLALLSSPEAAQQWPGYQSFLKSVRLIVGVRSGQELEIAEKQLASLQSEGKLLLSSHPHVSSSNIRHRLMQGKDSRELLSSLRAYVRANWLYVSVAVNNS